MKTWPFVIIAAGVMILLYCSMAFADDWHGGASADYVSVGNGAGATGWESHGGYRGLEVGWRGFSSADIHASGPTVDGYWHWKNYFATAGVDHLMIRDQGVTSQEWGYRAGGGLEFGVLRAALRYENIHHSNGLAISLGLEISP